MSVDAILKDLYQDIIKVIRDAQFGVLTNRNNKYETGQIMRALPQLQHPNNK